jgi:hypothetical protein
MIPDPLTYGATASTLAAFAVYVQGQPSIAIQILAIAITIFVVRVLLDHRPSLGVAR